MRFYGKSLAAPNWQFKIVLWATLSPFCLLDTAKS